MALHALGIKVTGILHTLTGSQTENIGGSPLSIHLMEANDVTAGLCQTASYALSIGMIREAASTVKDNAPETGRCAIFELKLVTLDLAEAVLTCGLFIFENPGNINGHTVRIPVCRNITRHMNYSFSYVNFDHSGLSLLYHKDAICQVYNCIYCTIFSKIKLRNQNTYTIYGSYQNNPKKAHSYCAASGIFFMVRPIRLRFSSTSKTQTLTTSPT